MITDNLSAYLECLQDEGIKHNLFIEPTIRELHLWDEKRFNETLILLESRGVKISSIVRVDDADQAYPDQCFYIIRF